MRSFVMAALCLTACGGNPSAQPAPPANPGAPTAPTSSDPAPGPGAGPVPPRRSPECGGFAGFKCPDGQECVDDPSDGCDPQKGGFDCGGVCRPANSGSGGGASGTGGGKPCGKVTCPSGQECCNASCGVCTPPGGGCTQQFCE